MNGIDDANLFLVSLKGIFGIFDPIFSQTNFNFVSHDIKFPKKTFWLKIFLVCLLTFLYYVPFNFQIQDLRLFLVNEFLFGINYKTLIITGQKLKFIFITRNGQI